MSVNISFDGYDLDHVSEWAENIDSRIQETLIPRRHGSYHEDDIVYGSRKITLRGTIWGASWEEVRTELDNMKEVFARGKKKLVFDDVRYIWATHESFNHSNTAMGKQGAVTDFTASFICKDPFWYSTTDESENNVIDNDSTVIIDNTGNIITPPTITILRTGGDSQIGIVRLTNESNDSKFVEYNAIILDAEELIIDCDNFTMEKDEIDVLDDFSGSFWNLVPGDNTIRLSLGSGTAADVTIAYTIRNI